MQCQGITMPHGKLTVFVDSGAGIEDPTVFGNGGSFCTLSCGSQVFSSSIVKGGDSHPYFNTAFEFEIDRSTNELDVLLFNKGTGRDDEMVGSCTGRHRTRSMHMPPPPPQGPPKVVVQQSPAIEWGYDCPEASPHGYESSGLEWSNSSRTPTETEPAASESKAGWIAAPSAERSNQRVC